MNVLFFEKNRLSPSSRKKSILTYLKRKKFLLLNIFKLFNNYKI